MNFMKRKIRNSEDKKIAIERIDILKNLINKHPKSHYNKRYKEIILKIKKKYRLFGGRHK